MADVFRELFRAEQTFLEYEGHPSDKVLRYYLKERLPKSIRPPSEVLEGLLKGRPAEWGEFEVFAHVRTCKRCTARLEWLQLPLWRRWFQRPISKGAVEYTAREPTGWRPAWVFATAALVVLALGSIGALYLQIINLKGEITALRLADEQERARLREAIDKLGEAVGKTEQSTAAAIEELKGIVIASTESTIGAFEGAKDERLIEITVNKDLSGYLRIYERIRGEVLFEGIVKKGSSIMKFGQSFEISWLLQDGHDALTIKGWEKIKRTEKGWQAVSEPRLVSDKPMECEARLIIIFPLVEGRRCP